MPTTEANRLVEFTRGLSDLDITSRLKCGYGHVGATLTDAVLQAGLRYDTVVAPRVERARRLYPNAESISGLRRTLDVVGSYRFLNWNHPEKPRRLTALTDFLLALGVETENDVAAWMSANHRGEALLGLKGIGPKTVDYLRRLVGVPSVAVDRHIMSFVAMAGIQMKSYEEIQKVVMNAADALGVDYSSFY